MYKKYYTVEWIIEFDDSRYCDRKRFEKDEGEKMSQFIFELSHKEGIVKIWKNTFEEFIF